MFRRALAASVAAASMAGGSAEALTITFDDVDPNPCCVFAPSYTSEGMVFFDAPGGLVFFPPDDNPGGFDNIDPSGASIIAQYTLRMEMAGGGTFDLLGFDYGVRNEPWAIEGSYDMRFRYADGHYESESLALTELGPSTLNLARSGLRAVEWRFINYQFGNTGAVVDNVVVANLHASTNPPEPGGGVPEPATWALMIAGFGLAGGALRRRQAVGA